MSTASGTLVNIKISLDGTSKCPPLACGCGDKMILFIKDPAKTADGRGCIVADILSRKWNTGNCKWEYSVSFSSTELAPGISGLQACDVSEQCCYTCAAQYADCKYSGIEAPQGFSCLDLTTLVACLEDEKTNQECDYTFDLTSGRIEDFPFALITLDTDSPVGDVVISGVINVIDVDDAVSKWNGNVVGYGIAVNDGGLFRLNSVPVTIERLQLQQGEETDWLPATEVPDTCVDTGPSQVFEDFCACVAACAAIEIDCPTILACINVDGITIIGDGSVGDPFEVQISATEGNGLVANPDGLFVDTGGAGAAKRSGTLTFILNNNVPSIRFMQYQDSTMDVSNGQPYHAPFNLTIKGISTGFFTFGAGSVAEFQIRINAATIGTIFPNAKIDTDDTVSVPMLAGDELTVTVDLDSGPGPLTNPYITMFVVED